MVEKRFDIFTVNDFKKNISRMKTLLINSNKEDLKKEFKSFNAIWDEYDNFLDGDGTLDIIHASSDYTDKDAYLYLCGDIDKEKVGLFYVVRNSKCDVYPIGSHKTVEDIVKQLNTEYEALAFFDNLFNKIEESLDRKDEKILDIMDLYDELINAEYYFENLDLFTEAYINPKSDDPKVQYTKEMIEKLKNALK